MSLIWFPLYYPERLAMKLIMKSALVTCAALITANAPGLVANAQTKEASSKSSSTMSDIRVFGRFMLDYTNADADNADFGINKTQIRRARLGASGKYGSNLKFKLEFNHSEDGTTDLTDGYVEWRPSKDSGSLRVGHFKTPNSLDESTSSKYTSTLERAALTDAFSLNRRLGVAWLKNSKRYSLFAGIYGENANEDTYEEGYALAGRATYVPMLSDDLAVHTGASFRFREQGDTAGAARIRQRPYSGATGRVLSTGSIAESDMFLGLEAAALYKNYWTAAEYSQLSADCSTCSNDPTFNGGYLEAGVFLGGKRGYGKGKFSSPKIDNPVTDGGKGAVSLIARYDTLDLEDGGVNGGSQDTIVVGADWWPVSKVRFVANFYVSDNVLGTSTSGLDSNFASLIGTSVTEEQVSGFLVRAQFEF